MKWTGKHWALALAVSVAIHSMTALVFVRSEENVEIERAAGTPIAVSAVSVAQAFQAQEHVIEPTSEAKAVENVTPDALQPSVDHSKPATRALAPDPVRPANTAKPLRPLRNDRTRPVMPKAQSVKTRSATSSSSLRVSQIVKRGTIQIASATKPEHVQAITKPAKAAETVRRTSKAVKPTAVAKQQISRPAQPVESTTAKQAAQAVLEPQTSERQKAKLQAITPVEDVQEALSEIADAVPSPKPRRTKAKPAPQQTKQKKVQKQKSKATKNRKPKTVVARLQKQTKKPGKKTSKRSKRSSQGRTGSKTKGRSAKRAGDGGRKQRATGKANISNYLGKVISRLHRQKRYPKDARRKKIQGTAVVAFVINANGSIGNLRIRRSAGHAMLDQAVLSMVRRAAPFPPIPAKSGKKRMPISVPVKFAVR